LGSIYVLIPLAILLVSIAIAVFFWAVKSNQFEDLERHGSSILFDDDLPKKKSEKTSEKASVKVFENESEDELKKTAKSASEKMSKANLTKNKSDE
jgi:cbb3-type cytochrome oxidase maturation protein